MKQIQYSSKTGLPMSCKNLITKLWSILILRLCSKSEKQSFKSQPISIYIAYILSDFQALKHYILYDINAIMAIFPTSLIQYVSIWRFRYHKWSANINTDYNIINLVENNLVATEGSGIGGGMRSGRSTENKAK